MEHNQGKGCYNLSPCHRHAYYHVNRYLDIYLYLESLPVDEERCIHTAFLSVAMSVGIAVL